MKKLRFIFAVLTAVSLTYGCKKKDPDSIKPVIESVLINGTASTVTASAGSTLSVTLQVSDNENLKQFKIDIHDAFDGHTHRNQPFSTQQIYSISGKSVTVTKTISLPHDAASGPYDVLITALDESGNESDIVLRHLVITQTGQPVIHITAPNVTEELDYRPGDILTLQGTITDDVDLEEIHIKLVSESGSAVVYDEDFDLSGTADLSWDFAELVTQSKEILIPHSTVPGHYALIIRAKDNEGNLTLVSYHVHID